MDRLCIDGWICLGSGEKLANANQGDTLGSCRRRNSELMWRPTGDIGVYPLQGLLRVVRISLRKRQQSAQEVVAKINPIGIGCAATVPRHSVCWPLFPVSRVEEKHARL